MISYSQLRRLAIPVIVVPLSLFWIISNFTMMHHITTDSTALHDDMPILVEKNTSSTQLNQVQTLAVITPPSPPPPPPPPPSRTVHWIDPNTLREHDGFSATWLQTKERFLQMNLENIGIVEGACFHAYKGKRLQMRMPHDWLDFSVEHLSKWWKKLGLFSERINSVAYDNLISALSNFLENYSVGFDIGDKVLHPTIALVAFHPTGGGMKDRADNVTVYSLAATIASLDRSGFGRVVVVGYTNEDEEYAKKAFNLLKSPTIEMGFANVDNESWYKTKHVEQNTPRAALFGLRAAFKGGLSSSETDHWLGTTHDHSYWKYVYLTEPDTILLTRPSALNAIHDELSKGNIVIPHRLQVVTHEDDIKGTNAKDYHYIHSVGNLSNVLEMDSSHSCCDQGPKWPGTYISTPKCGARWFECGYMRGLDPNISQEERHWRYLLYNFVRMKHGTGIIHLSGTNHGRQCKPSFNEVCQPPVKAPFVDFYLSE